MGFLSKCSFGAVCKIAAHVRYCHHHSLGGALSQLNLFYIFTGVADRNGLY